MAKKITTVVVAGGILANTLGALGVSAYSGDTKYPENKKNALVVTMLDVRNSRFSAYFYNKLGNVFKGVRLFGGEISDAAIEKVTGDVTAKNEYFRYDLYMDTWEGIGNWVEFTFDTTADLALNTANTLAYTWLYTNSASVTNLNIGRGRLNYSRCVSSEAYFENETAICRAEVWADGVVHYQPYIDWTRLEMPDDPEEDFVQVYKGTNWVSERIRGTDEPATDPDPTPADPVVNSEPSPVDPTPGENPVVNPEPEPVVEVVKEVIKEVPVEKIVKVPVEKIVEVPVEKIVEVPVEKVVEIPVEKRVEVPVEKKVTEIKEVIREVPVFANILSGEQTTAELSLTTGSEALDEISAEATRGGVVENNGTGEDAEGGLAKSDDAELAGELMNPSEAELADLDNVELPELGREDDSRDWAAKLATFSAGLVSALALLILAVAFRRKKQKGEISE